MFTHTITIGRSVGDLEMNRDDWEAFIGRANAALARATTGLFVMSATTHTGPGVWLGMREDAATLSRVSERAMTRPVSDLLKGELAMLCREHGQDAIALSVNVCATLITFDAHSGI